MLIQGSCHCGNISFDLDWTPDPLEIPARACDCSFCVKHGGVWTSNRDGSLCIRIRDQTLASEYAFGTRTAQFHVCRQCGVVPVVTSEIGGRAYSVVNVNAFNNVEQSILRRSPVSFDGEGTDSRLNRRTRNWIADVRFLEDGVNPS